jgi:hypothetical protein
MMVIFGLFLPSFDGGWFRCFCLFCMILAGAGKNGSTNDRRVLPRKTEQRRELSRFFCTGEGRRMKAVQEPAEGKPFPAADCCSIDGLSQVVRRLEVSG